METTENDGNKTEKDGKRRKTTENDGACPPEKTENAGKRRKPTEKDGNQRKPTESNGNAKTAQDELINKREVEARKSISAKNAAERHG